MIPSRNEILDESTKAVSFAGALTEGFRIIDVRSPKEFLEGSLPDAVNIPVFDDEQRKFVGTIYRQNGSAEAVDAGFSLVESRLQQLLGMFEAYRGEQLAVFCARGGMRSRSIVNLLRSHGYSARQLTGGYKKYRHWLLQLFEQFRPSCIVLHGHTGTGKTRILQCLDGVIDLEDLAQHQSSLFGAMNRTPRTQKDFDSHLHRLICILGAEPYFIEGESRKMGNIYLPAGLAAAMKNGHLVRVEASVETRVARIVEDYPVDDDATAAEVLTILQSLRDKLGGDCTETLCTLLRQRKLAELVYILLTEYYDKRYDNNLNKYSYQLEISSENIESAAMELQHFRSFLVQSS